MTEEELLDSIFNEAGKWKDKYRISYCDLCDTATISCPDCKNSSCNGGGCEKCHDDFLDFLNVRYRVEDYITEEEKFQLQKFRRIKDFILKALKLGYRGVPWKEFQKEGFFSKNDEKYLADFLK